MDVKKPLVLIVLIILGVGVYFMTGGGMDTAYDSATSSLPGNDPDQDMIDEQILSKYGGMNMSMLRYEKSKKFYKAAVDRYKEGGKNYWYNLEQLAKCEEKLDNEAETLRILYYLWIEDGDSHDERVSNRDQLKGRIQKLIELNGLSEFDFPMVERR